MELAIQGLYGIKLIKLKFIESGDKISKFYC